VGAVKRQGVFSRARKFTIQEREPGLPPAASMLDAMVTTPFCCPRAGCS